MLQLATTIDDYLYTPDDAVLEGEVEEGRRYEEKDFNRRIEIRQREEYRVQTFMTKIAPKENTLVFCATQDHAAMIRDIINQNKQGSDLFDVFAYIAYARAPTPRTERVEQRRSGILSQYYEKTGEFLDFVLSHYVEEGVDQLDTDNLKGLLTLKYGSTHDAASSLGSVKDIRQNFVGFQRGLYSREDRET